MPGFIRSPLCEDRALLSLLLIYWNIILISSCLCLACVLLAIRRSLRRITALTFLLCTTPFINLQRTPMSSNITSPHNSVVVRDFSHYLFVHVPLPSTSPINDKTNGTLTLVHRQSPQRRRLTLSCGITDRRSHFRRYWGEGRRRMASRLQGR